MARDTLTESQQRIYDFLVSYQTGKGYIPSYDEICDHFGFKSKKAVFDHLERLERKGYIKRKRRAEECKFGVSAKLT